MSGLLNSTGAVSGILGTTVGTPATSGRYFHAYKTSGQAISSATDTHCTFQTVIQSDSSFASSIFTATADDAGDWLFLFQLQYYSPGGSPPISSPEANIWIDTGSGYAVIIGGYYWRDSSGTHDLIHMSTQAVLTIANGDAIKFYANVTVGSGSPTIFETERGTSCTGTKL